MKQLWTEKYDSKYAIKVIHSNGDFPIQMELYDRSRQLVFRIKDKCPERDGCEAGYSRAMAACRKFADEHGNNGDWIYVHNPYHTRCENIKI